MWNSLILGKHEGLGPRDRQHSLEHLWQLFTTLATLKHSVFLAFFFFFLSDSKDLLSALSGATVRYTFCYSSFTDKETEAPKIK